MQHKRLLALLSTAVLAITAVPALPVSAADSAPPASQSEQETQSFFTPGFDWERYGTFSLSVGTRAIESKKGYCGLCGTLSNPDADFFILTNTLDWKPDKTMKLLKKLEIGSVEYEVYTGETAAKDGKGEKQQYWCIPTAAKENADMNTEIKLHLFLDAWQNLGLPAGKLESLESFVMELQKDGSYQFSTPEVSAITPVEIKTADPEEMPVRVKDGENKAGDSWEVYQSEDKGTAWIVPNDSAGFNAGWEDIPEGGRNLLSYSLPREGFPLTILRSDKNIQFEYCCAESSINGEASIGTVTLLTSQDAENAKQSEVYIIDGWSGVRPEFGTQCGSTIVEGVRYDIYKRNIKMTVGSIWKEQERTQYWIVSTENKLTKLNNGSFVSSQNITRFLNTLEKQLTDTPEIWLITLAVDVTSGSGSVSCTKAACTLTNASGKVGMSKSEQSDDGYVWYYGSLGSAPISFEYTQKGTFACQWEDADQTVFRCGEDRPLDDPGKRGIMSHYRYELDYDINGTAMIGIYCEFPDLNATFHIVEGTNKPVSKEMEYIGNTWDKLNEYRVYQSVAMEESSVQYWFFRQNSPFELETTGTLKNTVDVSALLNYVTPGRSEFLNISNLSFEIAADEHGSGSAKLMRNQIVDSNDPDASNPVSIKGMIAKDFEIGKTVIPMDYMTTDTEVQDYLLDNYNVASFEFLLTPGTYLSSDWKPGDPIKLNFNMYDKALSYCETYGIPIVIGPIIQFGTPFRLTFYQDENGNFLSEEAMNKRLEELIEATFRTLRDDHPSLNIKAAIVSSDYLTRPDYYYTHDQYLDQIYGESNLDFLSKLIFLTKSYGGNDCKVYIEEGIPENEEACKALAETAKQLQAGKDYLEGIALYVTTSSAEDWQRQEPLFDQAVTAIQEKELDLILSDVMVSARPAYNDTIRSAAYKAIFTSFLLHSDAISMVLLNDSGQTLDGPHQLREVKGFEEAIEEACQTAKEVKEGTGKQSDIRRGDVNCDKAVDVSDAVLLARFIAEDTTAVVTQSGRANSDADGNGKIESDDVIQILKIVAKLV